MRPRSGWGNCSGPQAPTGAHIPTAHEDPQERNCGNGIHMGRDGVPTGHVMVMYVILK